jgi:hypothetical protein
MLSDFLTLELYFGAPESALFFEDLTKHHDDGDIKHALKKGDVVCKRIVFGPDRGRMIYSLSEQGRAKVAP